MAADSVFHRSSLLETEAASIYTDLRGGDSLCAGEIALWRAVLTQALLDAASHSLKRHARLDKHRALAWLSGQSEDFRTVCNLADLEVGYVLQRVRASLARGCKWRTAPTCSVKKRLEKKKRRFGNEKDLAAPIYDLSKRGAK